MPQMFSQIAPERLQNDDWPFTVLQECGCEPCDHQRRCEQPRSALSFAHIGQNLFLAGETEGTFEEWIPTN
jgi:hypothetical protein